MLASVEVCAGAGGQALGLERAGFDHELLLEIDPDACATLRMNRPAWSVLQGDLRSFRPQNLKGIDLFAGGLPCPPFSRAGKQLGETDERDLFPAALQVIDELRPKAILIENVKGILDPIFDAHRGRFGAALDQMGYQWGWKLLHARDFGVCQLRPRAFLVAMTKDLWGSFEWPMASIASPTVGETLGDLMGEAGWEGAEAWVRQGGGVAPTIVGGSRKHGGPDLGPTRARRAWESLGVDGRGIADHPPQPGFTGLPRLTIPMVARLQGFPDEWIFCGGKTSRYRQVGNALPPPVAAALGASLQAAFASKPQRCLAL